jgi:FtsP/CotA-like multicopper oxidase with cupredoxin domain
MATQSKTVNYALEANTFQWEIAQGKSIKAWGFNNQVPGPVLQANKGDELVVHFINHLDEPTVIHWHGLRLPPEMDGTEEVQKPVMPGETFDYRFHLPDAGTFWFHPHLNETVQVERGMYGTIVVKDENEPVFDNDRVFMLDDMKLNSKNEFTKPTWFYPRWMERHDGREGNTLLINGQMLPTIEMAAGQIERWRLVNASNARFYLFSMDNKPFKIIGTDGGLIEKAISKTELLITPGERYDIAVGPFEEGQTIDISSLPYNRGVGKPKKDLLGTIKVGASMPSKTHLPDKLRTIVPLADKFAPVTRHIKLHGNFSWKDFADFTINDVSHLHDKPVKVGELQVWELTNPSMMEHPFHLHGFFFQVLSINDETPEYLSWKDTVNVPRNAVIKITWMPDNRPGKWMYHCHILEHAAAGMMAHFEVVA